MIPLLLVGNLVICLYTKVGLRSSPSVIFSSLGFNCWVLMQVLTSDTSRLIDYVSLSKCGQQSFWRHSVLESCDSYTNKTNVL
ncbi:hypothetical protein F4859DRAFT_175091 [Xylaria cf. heliscus]|nr:hypothetical protein F4859DRAFT_175091 [Xylaria cf. heliscus]